MSVQKKIAITESPCCSAVEQARSALPSTEEAEQLEFLLHLIADRVRFRILSALAQVEELCVHELALTLELTDDAVSYALRQLRAVRMVQNRREGRLIYYRLSAGFPRQLLEHCLVQLVRLSEGSESAHISDSPINKQEHRGSATQ